MHSVTMFLYRPDWNECPSIAACVRCGDRKVLGKHPLNAIQCQGGDLAEHPRLRASASHGLPYIVDAAIASS